MPQALLPKINLICFRKLISKNLKLLLKEIKSKGWINIIKIISNDYYNKKIDIIESYDLDDEFMILI